MRLASIHVYPLKGARGVSLGRSAVLRGGLRHDRRFMILGAADGFLTQRSHPRLVLVTVALDEASLTVSIPGGGAAVVPLDDASYRARPRRRAKVWRDEVDAVVVPGDVATLVSDHLGERCTVVYMPDDVVRPVDPTYGREGDRVGFADGYPVLVGSLASLADLNARLSARGEAEVPMNRFRPNLVVDGGAAFDEERFAHVTVGSIRMRLAKRCSRCEVPNVDPETAETGKEPLRTLASYRTENNKAYFAMNAIPDAEGEIAVGDPVVYDTPL